MARNCEAAQVRGLKRVELMPNLHSATFSMQQAQPQAMKARESRPEERTTRDLASSLSQNKALFTEQLDVGDQIKLSMPIVPSPASIASWALRVASASRKETPAASQREK